MSKQSIYYYFLFSDMFPTYVKLCLGKPPDTPDPIIPELDVTSQPQGFH